MQAFYLLCRLEGIIPAAKSSHPLVYAMRYVKEHNTGSILVTLSGRGGKDLAFVVEKYSLGEHFLKNMQIILMIKSRV
ncbi:MAG: hypothetical protein J6K72_06140 [Clostridia bacterium]|nr:hypothetical protein [Clostridia bacterium]